MVQNWPCLKEIQLDIQEAENARQEAHAHRAAMNRWQEALIATTEACALITRAQDVGLKAVALSKLAWAVKPGMTPRQKEEARNEARAKAASIETPPPSAHAAWYATESIRVDFKAEVENSKTEAIVAEKWFEDKWGYKYLGPLSDWTAIREQLSGRVKVQRWPGEGEVNMDEVGQQLK